MILDSRILPGKKPFTVFDVEEAKAFIGRKGFFGDSPVDFTDLSPECLEVLKFVVTNEADFPYCDNQGLDYRYFLPLEFWEDKP